MIKFQNSNIFNFFWRRNKAKRIFSQNKGFSIAEIIIVVAIIGIALTTLLGVIVFSLKISNTTKEIALADALIQEAIEVVRNFRDGTSWNTDGIGALNTGEANPYYPKLDNSTSPPKWILFPGSETINDFTRKVIIEKVSRDPISKNIESSYNPDHDDSETRKIIATVSWKNKKIETVTYFTNWQ